jgi:MFS family permease
LQNSLTLSSYRNKLGVAVFASLITFLTYCTVYGFRKGFTICTFDGMAYAGISYKVWLVISQVLGYASSKFYGIRFISELKKMGRGKVILYLTGISWLALFLFAITPAPWNIFFMFINGFPLGMIWGIIFSYVEGRMTTDFIGAALSVSFIFSSGFVKSVAEYIRLHFNITELWVPFYTGLAFAIPLIFCVIFLEKIPPPSEEDMIARSKRHPMSKEDRKKFVRIFFPGLVAAISVYVFSTMFRDLRDNFIADMWIENGYGNQPSLFTKTETPVSVILLILMGSMILVKNNLRAFKITHYIIITGFLITGITSLLYIGHLITPFWWLALVGLGLYTTYIPFNCIFFERLLATFKYPGTVGFLIYVADSFGYLGSVGVLFTKEFLRLKINWSNFYSHGVVILSVLGIAGAILSLLYFSGKFRKTIPGNG